MPVHGEGVGTPRGPGAQAGRRRQIGAVLAAAAGIALLQIVLLVHFEPPSLILADVPVSGLDLDTHVEQAWRVTEALDGWGRSWAYDERLLAGYPNGTFFDADNKAWEVWTFVLWKAGLPKGTAFNLFVWMAHILAPWAVLAAARLFRLGWRGALAAAAAALAIWYFDSFAHKCWWIGMTAYAMSAYLFLVVVGLLDRYVEKGGWWRATLLAAAAAVAHLVHPYTLVMIAPPAIAIYARSARTMGWRRHAGVWAAAMATIAANAWWLATAFRFRHYVQGAGRFGQSTLSTLVMDFLGLKDDPEITGYMGNRTGFRVLVLASSIAALALWRSRKDRRFLPLATAMGAMLALTYLGGYLGITRQIQPYRHILPAMMAGAILAGAFVEELWSSGALRSIPRDAWSAAAVVCLVALPYLARDVVYFLPGLLPDVAVQAGGAGSPSWQVEPRLGDERVSPPRVRDYRRQPPGEDFRGVARWVDESCDGSGRILVEAGFLGEHLAWRTRAQIIGGFVWRNMLHSSANLFRRLRDASGTDIPLREYLEDYAIRWIVVTRYAAEADLRSDLFDPVASFPPQKIYRTRIDASFVASGGGRARASMNRIDVEGSTPGEDVVLRFHFLETLACEEGCRIERENQEGDAVGFIRVPAPHPADFAIVNGY